MPRSLSSTALRAVFAQETGEAFITLLTLTHPTFGLPIRVCDDGQDLVSAGQTYQQFPFNLTMPEDTDEAPPTLQLSIDNVDCTIVNAVRSVSGDPIEVVMEIVMASSPDVIEAGPLRFLLRDVEYTVDVVTGTLAYEDILNEPYPDESFNPADYPGLS